MKILKIHEDMVTAQTAEQLMAVCPFGALNFERGILEINSACKMCTLCVKNGPDGVITMEEEKTVEIEKDKWKGIAVYGEYSSGKIHPVVLELIGKARELALVGSQPIYACIIGNGISQAVGDLLYYGVDEVFVYDKPELQNFVIGPYANALEDFINRIHPSAVLVGATNQGRSLAPRVAARFRAGLTADCTMLEIRKNTDLVQIRPAFGGNIMAQIVTPNSRPQFCTVRYKVFNSPKRSKEVIGKITELILPDYLLRSGTVVESIFEKSKEVDLAEAEVIVAVGRGIKSKRDLAVVEELAEYLKARMACTRPLIEAGWFDARHQIGLSGRTVKPKLIITLGISGSVQFAAGMKGADCIIAVNQDRNASIFNVAHYGFVGDLYEIIPRLMELLKGGNIR